MKKYLCSLIAAAAVFAMSCVVFAYAEPDDFGYLSVESLEIINTEYIEGLEDIDTGSIATESRNLEEAVEALE